MGDGKRHHRAGKHQCKRHGYGSTADGIGGGGITGTVINGSDLTVTLSSGESLTLLGWTLGSNYTLNRFSFEVGEGAGVYSLSVADDNTPTWTLLTS